MLLSEVPTPSEVFFGRDSSTRGLAGWIPTQGGVFGQDSDAAKSCRADSGRSGFLGRLSDITNIFGQELDAQEPPSVQMSPDNKFIVQISPENEAASESRPKTPRCSDLARKHCGERAEDTRPTNGPCAAHGDLYATRTPFHASHSAQHVPLNPLNQPPAEARKNLFASRCRRQLPGSDFVQIHVRYLSDTSAFSLLAYLATNET